MKKTIISIAAAVLCASVLSTNAFAENILSNKDVYADKHESIAIEAGTMDVDSSIISVDPNTVMPYYYASLYDYAKTGKMEIIPYSQKNGNDDAGERFVANAVNADGKFVGTVEFNIGGAHPGIRIFSPSSDKADSVAFELNARRINAIMEKQKINSDCQEVKFVFVVGLGNVYYINNGTSEFLAASNLGWVNGDVFNDENGGIIEIGDDLKAYMERRIAEEENPSEPASGDNPLEGGYETPMFTVDNTPYLDEDKTPDDDHTNPNTGNGLCAVASTAALVSLAAGAIVVVKRRKNK